MLSIDNIYGGDTIVNLYHIVTFYYLWQAIFFTKQKNTNEGGGSL